MPYKPASMQCGDIFSVQVPIPRQLKLYQAYPKLPGTWQIVETNVEHFENSYFSKL